MKVMSQRQKLRNWLRRSGLQDEDASLLSGPPTEPAGQQRALRFLNALESRFDESIATDLGAALDWGALREELQLLPGARTPWLYLGARAAEIFRDRGDQAEHIERAERLWRDFLFLQEGQIKALQASSGWVAALDYLIQGLYFRDEATQAEVGARYGVSASTVGLRFRALVETLGVVLYDHPVRKRLAAARALAVETGKMSEAEFNRRLLRSEGRLDASNRRGGPLAAERP
ncbi:MAG TPA: hypothetical protein VER55_08245 [Ardenticatenaceae bacterium]|nr:hypothetical protein [Ardenticatenaceae bacterium]